MTTQMTTKQGEFLTRKLSAEVSSRRFNLKKDKLSLKKKTELFVRKKKKLSKQIVSKLKNHKQDKAKTKTETGQGNAKSTAKPSTAGQLKAGQLKTEQKNLQKGYQTLEALVRDVKVKKQAVSASSRLLMKAEKKLEKLGDIKAASAQIRSESLLVNQEQELLELKINQGREAVGLKPELSEGSLVLSPTDNAVSNIADLQNTRAFTEASLAMNRSDHHLSSSIEFGNKEEQVDYSGSEQGQSAEQQKYNSKSANFQSDAGTQSVEIDYSTEEGKNYNLQLIQDPYSGLAVKINSMDGVSWTEQATSQLKRYLSGAGYRNVKVEFASNA